MLNALRLREGFRPADFERSTGLSMEAILPTIAALEARGLIDSADGRIRPSELGFRFLNDVQSAFLSVMPSLPADPRPGYVAR